MGLGQVIFESIVFKAVLLDMLFHFLHLLSPLHLNKSLVWRGGNGHLLTPVRRRSPMFSLSRTLLEIPNAGAMKDN